MLKQLLASLGRRKQSLPGPPASEAGSLKNIVLEIDAAANAKEWDRALTLVEGAIGTHKREPALAIRAAMLYQERKGHEKALAHLSTFLSMIPNDATGILAYVRSLHHLGRFDDASDFLKDRAHEVSPTRSGEIALWRGLSKLRQMSFEEARSAFLQSYQLNPSTDIPLQLASYAKVMEFKFPCSRKVLTPAITQETLKHLEPTVVAYFYMSQAQAPRATSAGIDYLELLATSAASAKRAMPGIRTVLLTDEVTDVPNGAVDNIYRVPLPTQALMKARLLAMEQFLNGNGKGQVIFSGPAAYFVADCRGVFNSEFDIAYTWRSDLVESMQDVMPIYAGVTMVSSTGVMPAISFVRNCLECLDAMDKDASVREAYPDGIQRWWGDQLAPSALIGWGTIYDTVLPGKSDRLMVNGTIVRLLDADLYNYPMQSIQDSPVAGRYILSFKGERKRLMTEFARRQQEKRLSA